MKAFRLGRWGSTVLAPGNKQSVLLFLPTTAYSPRFKSTNVELAGYGPAPTKHKRGRPKKRLAPKIGGGTFTEPAPTSEPTLKLRQKLDVTPSTYQKENLPSPAANTHSSKLAALHARLSLSSRIPEQTLARCLVDFTADPDHRFNNSNLAQLGNDVLGYYVSEHLICHYPRLPMVVLTAAIHALVGSETLAQIAHGWGMEVAAEPGGEVNPGLLQFQRRSPTKRVKEEILAPMQAYSEERNTLLTATRLGFVPTPGDEPEPMRSKTLQEASRDFVQAVFGAVYLHCGASATQEFFTAHILSRHLDIASLFTFVQPTRDLSRLCAREGFEPPIARIVSETGRASRHPVFVVGVFSGHDKIGEDVGGSLHEARWKAAAKALKGWYLYSPQHAGGELMLPSATIGQTGRGRAWLPAHVDDGEVVC